MSDTSSTIPARLQHRLEEIRGGARQRSPSVHVLAGYAQHTSCRLATLGFAARVDFDRLLEGTDFQAPFGQSPFAIARGRAFENTLRARGYAALHRLLRGTRQLPPDPLTVNLRTGFPPGPDLMPRRARATLKLLERILRDDPGAPHLIDGAVLTASIGGVAAYFEADALAACATRVLTTAEVKSFPKVDGRVDPEMLGAALDQAAFYILLARAAIERLGGDPERLVSDRAFLITPKNVGLTPTLSEQGVGTRVRRARDLLDSIPSVAEVVDSVPTGVSFGPVADTKADPRRRLEVLHDLADCVGTDYQPSCLSTCGNACFCRSRAFRDGSPCLAGSGAVRLLPGVATLGRAEELTHGATPRPEEASAAVLLESAGRLYDEATAGPVVPTAPTRRPA